MSRIQDALTKLQQRSRDDAPASVGKAPRARSVVPTARNKKIVLDGPRHHVSEDDLIRGGLLAPLHQSLDVADEFRRIKRPLIVNAMATGPDAVPNAKLIMVASAMPGAGKTFCSVNLAVSISLEREINVLLVDADVAKPHISRAFGLENAPGLIDLLVDEKADFADLLVTTDLNDIQVLPAGRQHPQATELLASNRMSAIANDLATRYDDRIIVLDSPPLLITSEAEALADQVGQIALVVEAGQTPRRAVQQCIDLLNPTKAINVILNKTWHSGPGRYYGEYGAYGSYGKQSR